MIFSLILLSLSSFFIILHQDNEENFEISIAKWTNLIGIFIYVLGYQIGFGSITWTIIGEIFPLKSRSQAISITIIINFICNYLIILSFLSFLSYFSLGFVFLVYLIISIFAFAFVFLFIPETKNRSLEDIEYFFQTAIFFCSYREKKDLTTSSLLL